MDFAANSAPNAAPDLLAAIQAQLMWVATNDDQVIGFVFAEPCADGLYVRELSVAAPWQQRGHGSALMTTLIETARARGDKQLVLTTDRSLPWNAPFYRRIGFEIVEGSAIPGEAQRRLEGQFAAGFDPVHRCAMVMPL